MVALPLFKLGSLLLRHVSKYGANYIKRQAHDHPKFRVIAERGGQSMHQLNMRFTVSALRDPAAEQRARERAEAPTVKTKEQTLKEEQEAKTASPVAKEKSSTRRQLTSIWKRKFRPLPENKAVDLFADVIGDGFILSIAIGLIMWEYLRSRGKPDRNDLRITELETRFNDVEKREEELESRERACEEKLSILEEALHVLEKQREAKPGLKAKLFAA